MNLKTELRFKPFDELLNNVLIDLRIIEEEGMIEPAQLIKVAQRVNYDLGLKIHTTKETILDVDNYVAKLPEDFYTLNFALLTGNYKVVTPITWGGRITENVDVPCSGVTDCLLPQTGLCDRPTTCDITPDFFAQNRVYSMCNGSKCVKVIQHVNSEVREYSFFDRLHIEPSKFIDPGSMNCKVTAPHTAQIKDGFIYTSIPCGKLYISYQGELTDNEGNLLVLDHPEINMYYESAITERILRNLYLGGEDMKQKYDEIKQETRENRARALNIVNMPNFHDLYSTWKLGRTAAYNRYYNAFHTNVFESFFKPLPY